MRQTHDNLEKESPDPQLWTESSTQTHLYEEKFDLVLHDLVVKAREDLGQPDHIPISPKYAAFFTVRGQDTQKTVLHWTLALCTDIKQLVDHMKTVQWET